MVTGKRVFWTTILGLIAGVLCYLLGKRPVEDYPSWMAIVTVLNRTIIGFVIGISGLRGNWAIHGIFWGLLISLMIAIPSLDEGNTSGFFMLMIAGAVWGFLIELLTSKVFKAPAAAISRKESQIVNVDVSCFMGFTNSLIVYVVQPKCLCRLCDDMVVKALQGVAHVGVFPYSPCISSNIFVHP